MPASRRASPEMSSSLRMPSDHPCTATASSSKSEPSAPMDAPKAASTLPRARASHRRRHLPLRTPPQRRQAHRRKSNPGNRHSARNGEPQSNRSAAVTSAARREGVSPKVAEKTIRRSSYRRRSQVHTDRAGSRRRSSRCRNHRLAQRHAKAARPRNRSSRRRKRLRSRRRDHDPQVSPASPLPARSNRRSAGNRKYHSRRRTPPSPRLSRIFPSSPSTEKPPAISTMPSTSANSKTATTNCRSTSPTWRNT